MALKSLFTGGGPAYRLTSDAPTAPGKTLISAGDGSAVWGDVSSVEPAADTSFWVRINTFAIANSGGAGSTILGYAWVGTTAIEADTSGGRVPYRLIEVQVETWEISLTLYTSTKVEIDIAGATDIANDSDLHGDCVVRVETLIGGTASTVDVVTRWTLPSDSRQLAIAVPLEAAVGGPPLKMASQGFSFFYVGKPGF